MKEIMNEVPDMLSGKDLDYLSDIYDWNFSLLKKCNDYMNYVKDEDINNMLDNVYQLCLNNLNLVLDILSEDGEFNE